MRIAVPLYSVGLALLLATAVMGITKKGATRWLNVGVVIQPSEIMKLAMPLMLAWWFQKREGQLRPLDFVVAAVLALILGEVDLGTTALIGATTTIAVNAASFKVASFQERAAPAICPYVKAKASKLEQSNARPAAVRARKLSETRS